jgi:hypothetical protein
MNAWVAGDATSVCETSTALILTSLSEPSASIR